MAENEDEDWSRYYEVLSDEEQAAWEARRQHLKRLQRITPEHIKLIKKMIEVFREYAIYEDDQGFWCKYCGESLPLLDEDFDYEKSHLSTCRVTEAIALFRLLDEAPHHPSPAAPSPH